MRCLAFREELLHDYGEGFIEGLHCLSGLGHQHFLTNKVRHAFERMDPEEAAAATHLFVSFCKLAGIDAFKQVHLLNRSLEVWRQHTSVLEWAAVIRGMQEETRQLRDRTRSLLEQRQEYEALKQELERYQRRLAESDLQIRKAPESEQQRKERLDELRRERNKLTQERNELLARMESYQDLERYLRYLGRLLCGGSTLE